MKNLLLITLIAGNLTLAQMDSQKSIDQKSLYTSDYNYQPEMLGARIIGSPFVDMQYKMGVIYQSGAKVMEAPMRYNANKEVIEYVDKDNNKKELPRQMHLYAELDGKEYRVMEFYDEGEKKLGYFNPLMQEGEYMLYFRPYKEILKEDTSSMTRRNHALCQDASAYYIKRKELPAVRTELTHKDVTTHLRQHSDKMEQYIKGFNLDLRKEADVIRALEFYNRLNS